MFDETNVLTTHSTNQSFNVLNFNNRKYASSYDQENIPIVNNYHSQPNVPIMRDSSSILRP